MLELLGIRFGSVLVASGALNFFGEGSGIGQGWPYHRWYKILFRRGFNFKGAGFMAKTTTMDSRAGNMPLDENFMPKERMPKCIKVFLLEGVALNAVGLSGPGAKVLFDLNKWQKRTEPFFISFMTVAGTAENRLEETKQFVSLFKHELSYFKTTPGLVINSACPNTENDPHVIIGESKEHLTVARELGIPLVLKTNTFMPVGVIKSIVDSGLCDALEVSNTIPWPKISDEEKMSYFGTEISPLSQFKGGGGASGKILLQKSVDYIRRLRQEGINIPIIGGGGILKPADVDLYTTCDVNVSAVTIGTVAMLRPWRVRAIIEYATKRLGK